MTIDVVIRINDSKLLQWVTMMQSFDARKGRSFSIDATEVDWCDGDDGSNWVFDAAMYGSKE